MVVDVVVGADVEVTDVDVVAGAAVVDVVLGAAVVAVVAGAAIVVELLSGGA